MADPKTPTVVFCGYYVTDENDVRIGPACGKPATSYSCMPLRDTPTCDEHKCRCARPLGAPWPGGFQSLRELAETLKRTFGPWQQQQGDLWIRPGVLGDYIVSRSEEGRDEADAKARSKGFTLLDIP
jgi:hypothetical protein